MFDGWTYEEIAEKHSEEYAARKRDKLRYRHGAIHICLVLDPISRQEQDLLPSSHCIGSVPSTAEQGWHASSSRRVAVATSARA